MDGQKPTVPSKEELELIRDFCILPMLLDIVEKNKKELDYTDSTLKPFYIMAAEALMNRVHMDIVNTRKELKRIGCKVNQLDRYDPAAIHFEYRLRGYRDEFGIWKSLVRSEMSTRLGKYLAVMTEMFKKPSTQ